MSLYQFALLWLVGTNLLAIVLTVSDKLRAKKGKWRVPEDTLLFVALLGGAVGEYITMRLIRHKTRHKKIHDHPAGIHSAASSAGLGAGSQILFLLMVKTEPNGSVFCFVAFSCLYRIIQISPLHPSLITRSMVSLNLLRASSGIR